MVSVRFSIVVLVTLMAKSQFIYAGDFPDEIKSVAIAHDCNKVVNGYYDEPLNIKSDYIYEFDQKKNKEAFVFWCESTKTRHNYFLIRAESSTMKKNECPELVLTTTGFPKSLSLRMIKSLNLSDYYFIDTREKGPDRVETNIVTIVEGDDLETSTHYFCYKGRYLFNSYD